MSLSPGTRIGSFEVVALIGAGGMGEVYRARDTRLNRDVALKVLPEAFSLDPERRSRFEREAQLLAALTHPHIATIHGIDESGGQITLVMELVEGPTLANRLSAGALPPDEARLIATEICEALEYAHERGIIHRDLKPANIKVTLDDAVKILDFGLAKAVEGASGARLRGDAASAGQAGGAGGEDFTQSPTLSLGATRQGVILGTAAYMAPEQARGQAVDRRGDIWAFGCVLFEMITGKQAFAGGTVSDTLAAVLRAEPDWSALPAGTTPSVRRLLRRCLEKDPKRRLQHIGDARLELGESDAIPVETGSTPPRTRRLPWPVLTAATAVAIVVGFAAWMLTPRPTPAPVTRFAVPISAAAPIGDVDFAGIALSPAGRTIVYVADRPRGLVQRRLDNLGFERVRGAEGGGAPFFSPDGAWIAFLADGKLKKVPAGGGLAVTICDCSIGRGSWGGNGTIVFASSGNLYEVAESGGTPRLILKSDKDGTFSQPWFVPGSKAVLVRRGPATAGRIEAVDLQTRATHALLDGALPQLAATGDLLFERQGKIWAVGFDAKRLAIVGTPVPVLESIRIGGTGGGSGATLQPFFAAARNGSIAYLTGNAGTNASMVWIDRAGRATPAVEARGAFQSPRLSPDGKRVVVSVDLDLWAYEFERGSRLKLTTTGRNRRTVWSPDGTRIAFYSTAQDGGDQDLFIMPSTGGEPKRLLERPGPQYPDTWSPDSRFIVFEEAPTGGGPRRDLWLLPLGEAPRSLLVTRFNERGAVFPPKDGHWLAFVTDESGRDEVYVQPFPGPGPKVTISTNGGIQPMWSRDGRELFYREGEWLMAVSIQLAPFRVMATRKLFELPGALYNFDQNFADYDVAPDGRFLAIRRDAVVADEIQIVLNWTEELRRALKR